MEKKIFIAFIFTLFLVVFIPAYGISESSRQGKALARITEQSSERGAEILVSICASCHGPGGEGAIGPAIKNTQLDKEALGKTITFGRPAKPVSMPAMGQEMGGPLKPPQIEDVINFLQNWDESFLAKARTKHITTSTSSETETTTASTGEKKATPLPEQASSKPQELSIPTPTPQENRSALPTPSPSGQVTAPPIPAPSPFLSQEQVISQGKELYSNFGCAACHGSEGKGSIGPPIAGKNRDQIFRKVRDSNSQVMPSFSSERIPDTDLDKIAAFIASLSK